MTFLEKSTHRPSEKTSMLRRYSTSYKISSFHLNSCRCPNFQLPRTTQVIKE